jgi:hypothetical protein
MNLIITNPVPPPAILNQPYPPFQFTAIGGKGLYIWSAIGLPIGMTMGDTGILSGTPISLGAFSVTVRVRDK